MNTALVSTIAIGLNGTVSYALEGSVFVGGAVVQWLRDEMRFMVSAKDSEYFAASVEDNGSICVVPAFTGFGAPPLGYARGCRLGLTRGSETAAGPGPGLPWNPSPMDAIIQNMARLYHLPSGR